jgi:hypothetical protein
MSGKGEGGRKEGRKMMISNNGPKVTPYISFKRTGKAAKAAETPNRPFPPLESPPT